MTAIAVLVDKGTIYMGGDSAGVCGLSLEIRKDPKIFIKGKFIIGFTSSFRMGQLLHYKFKPPRHPPKMSIDQYMNIVFVDTVRECFKKGGYTHVENNKESGGTFMVGYKKRLFIIESDFQVGEPINNFSAVGCGEDLCLGSLYTSKNEKPKERIRLALEAAECYNGGVRRPFVIKTLG